MGIAAIEKIAAFLTGWMPTTPTFSYGQRSNSSYFLVYCEPVVAIYGKLIYNKDI